jgi:hypothetical protein
VKTWVEIWGRNSEDEKYHSFLLVDNEHRVWAEILTHPDGFCECEFHCDAGLQKRLYLDLDSAKGYCEMSVEGAAEVEMLNEAQRREDLKNIPL